MPTTTTLPPTETAHDVAARLGRRAERLAEIAQEEKITDRGLAAEIAGVVEDATDLEIRLGPKASLAVRNADARRRAGKRGAR